MDKVLAIPFPHCQREDRTLGLWGRRCPCRGWSGWLCRTASSSASWCWRWCPGRARHSTCRTWHFWWKLALLLTIDKNVFDWLWNENIVMWSGFNFIHNVINQGNCFTLENILNDKRSVRQMRAFFQMSRTILLTRNWPIRRQNYYLMTIISRSTVRKKKEGHFS